RSLFDQVEVLLCLLLLFCKFNGWPPSAGMLTYFLPAWVTLRVEQLWSKSVRIPGNNKNHENPNPMKAESEVTIRYSHVTIP
ncbi:MAG TPA: hypothetical protein VFM05_00820, partial [Candidatus Saccharimonadales bacterium]|nr:hypothetical protein [Candidatus Saccharimonadales bacterium]